MIKLLLITATFISANAFAGDHAINVVGRGGLVYKDNDPAKTTTANSSSMNFDYLRTTFAGVLTPTVKYFLTTDLLGATGNDAVNGTSTLIDEAYITKTFSFGTSAIFGKKGILICGKESDYLDYDRYTSSYFKTATPSNQVGLTLSHDVAGQTLVAQYFNGNKDNGKGTTVNAQSKFAYALGWYGNLLNGMIKPSISYTVVPEALGTATSTDVVRVNKGNDQFIVAGIELNTPHNVTIETDYHLLTEKDATGTIASKKDLKTTSLVALVRFNGEKMSPFVKYIADTRKNDSTKTAQRSAYDIGLEFKESNDDAVRYHVVYSGASVKSNMNTTEVKSSPSSVMIGVKFDASVLK